MDRLSKIFDFIKEIDKEKFIGRQTYLSDGKTKEDDSQHAWHIAVMALLLSEYANEDIDVLRTVSMLLIHDIVEIDAGDTYAYDETAKATQAERELKAAERIFGLLPEDLAEKFMNCWLEFEEGKTPESKFAHAMDNIQPTMLNFVTGGKAWKEHEVMLSKVLKRNGITSEGSRELWDYSYNNFITPHVNTGNITDDTNS